MEMPGRIFNDTAFRFGFNNKEKDDEVFGSGDEYNYGMRIYDSRLGRFLSVDPLDNTYCWLSPYQYAENQPIFATDLDGLEKQAAIIYGSNADASVVNKATEDNIKKLANAIGATSVQINSTVRSPEHQAEVMYSTNSTYAASGAKVQALRDKMNKEGKTKEETIAAMTDLINQLGPSTVSNHCADPSKIITVDIDLGSIPKGQYKTLIAEAKKMKEDGIIKEIQYPAYDGEEGNNEKEGAFHIAFYANAPLEKSNEGNKNEMAHLKQSIRDLKATMKKFKQAIKPINANIKRNVQAISAEVKKFKEK